MAEAEVDLGKSTKEGNFGGHIAIEEELKYKKKNRLRYPHFRADRLIILYISSYLTFSGYTDVVWLLCS